MNTPAWQVFNLDELIARAHTGDADYQEFIHEPTMSCGIYHLKAGSTDMQGYHDEDEVYVVLEGKGRLRVGDDDQPVKPGAVLFVRASEDHAFFEIEEDMTMLVLFAAASSGLR
ncbi:MAG: cupin domain-containing protein [Gammaproteobacteria bacterium]